MRRIVPTTLALSLLACAPSAPIGNDLGGVDAAIDAGRDLGYFVEDTGCDTGPPIDFGPPPDLGYSGGTTPGTNGVQRYTNQAMELQAPSGHRGEVTATNSGAFSGQVRNPPGCATCNVGGCSCYSVNFQTSNHRGWHPVIGDTGRVVPIRDPAALSQALFEVITLPDDERRRLGIAARARIAERFQLGDIVGRYERLWQSIARR